MDYCNINTSLDVVMCIVEVLFTHKLQNEEFRITNLISIYKNLISRNKQSKLHVLKETHHVFPEPSIGQKRKHCPLYIDHFNFMHAHDSNGTYKT